MNSDTVNQVSNEIGSALTEILPDLHSLLKDYRISQTLDITLVDLASTGSMNTTTCCFHGGRMRCDCTARYGIPSNQGDTLGLDPERAKLFCKKVASKLDAVLPRLKRAVRQAERHFEVQFLIDPSKANSVNCKWSSGEGDMLQCSSS
jgi:hypothetical protein